MSSILSCMQESNHIQYNISIFHKYTHFFLQKQKSLTIYRKNILFMKSYIHLYKTNDKFTEAYNGPDYIEPWLSLTEENMEVNYNKPKLIDFSTEPLTFNILSAGTINWTASNKAATKTIDYKLNDNEWASIASNTGSSAPTITVNPGDKLQFKGNNEQYGPSTSAYNSFSGSTALFEAEGNIMSLIYGDDFKNNSTISSKYAFFGLFRGCTKLVSAKNLVLPAITLTTGCYSYMFRDCTSLTTAPELPATTLATECYSYMFYGCTSLTTAPELPANTLKPICYQYMFQGCTSLTTAPSVLPATTLAYSCYVSMFDGCKNLTTAPALPATTLTDYCYDYMFQGCTSLTTAPELPATTLTQYCYECMFNGCTSLTTAPELPATTLASYCYKNMFQNCTSLTKAPELPATTLAGNCYSYMFQGCTSLNYVKCLATNISASNCTYDWVYNVASTGTFVKASSMTSWTTGTSGIPTGWTVQDA